MPALVKRQNRQLGLWFNRSRLSKRTFLCATRTHSYSLAEVSRIESRIALRRNRPFGSCQTSKNVALTCDDALAKAECLGGFEIGDELEFRRLLHRQVGWLLAPKR